MKLNVLSGLLTAITAIATVFSASDAMANSVSRDTYDAQYESASDDFMHLEYDQWKLFNDLINKERNLMDAIDLPTVDLANLRWEGGVNDVEVYFINEGAGYRNQLFYSTDSGTTKEIIFDDISSPNSILRNSDGPLSLGQGVSLGDFEGETYIEFFLKSNGKNGGQNFFGFDPTENPDGFPHVLAYTIDDFVLIGFEDLWNGGDKDYNDTVFVVRGVTDSPIPVPEPTTTLALLGITALGATRIRRSHS
ncbi:MAG: DUF4114 domain-containing protein [Cyanobacteria bacterium SBLK]|nr:DUF4114 domain-containing protein [Cyanobacteria bacterium SBLK]